MQELKMTLDHSVSCPLTKWFYSSISEFRTHAALHLEVERLVIILWSVGLVFALDQRVAARNGVAAMCCALRVFVGRSVPSQSLDAFKHSQDSLDPLNFKCNLHLEN